MQALSINPDLMYSLCFGGLPYVPDWLHQKPHAEKMRHARELTKDQSKSFAYTWHLQVLSEICKVSLFSLICSGRLASYIQEDNFLVSCI